MAKGESKSKSKLDEVQTARQAANSARNKRNNEKKRARKAAGTYQYEHLSRTAVQEKKAAPKQEHTGEVSKAEPREVRTPRTFGTHLGIPRKPAARQPLDIQEFMKGKTILVCFRDGHSKEMLFDEMLAMDEVDRKKGAPRTKPIGFYKDASGKEYVYLFRGYPWKILFKEGRWIAKDLTTEDPEAWCEIAFGEYPMILTRYNFAAHLRICKQDGYHEHGIQSVKKWSAPEQLETKAS